MRKLLAAALVLGSLMQFTPSQAKAENYKATALPCLVTCHNWLADAGFTPCGAQLMGGNSVGYHSQKFKLAAGTETLVSAKPPVDWDIWICSNVGTGGEEAAVAFSANSVAEECTSPVGTSLVAVACYEEVTVTFASILLAVGGNAALAAKGFEIRAYNWSDTGELQIDLDGDQIRCGNQTPGNGLC